MPASGPRLRFGRKGFVGDFREPARFFVAPPTRRSKNRRKRRLDGLAGTPRTVPRRPGIRGSLRHPRTSATQHFS
jgi:hypothetical protein